MGSNSYHKIIRSNSKLVDTETLTRYNKITPVGLELWLETAVAKNDKLNVTISFPSVKTGMPATLCMVFYFERDKIFAQREVIKEEAKDDIYSLNIPLSSEIKKAFKTNKKPLVYLAVTGVPVKRKVFWTSTIVEQL